jgi:predicted  nucleic acid-binding Zn-ribbon protein
VGKWTRLPVTTTVGRHLAHPEKVIVMDRHENLQELLTRLNNIRDSMEGALADIKGIEDDYRRGLLEAHIKGAIREINEQITELVSQRRR